MGRFGNVMLVSGEPDLSLDAKRGEVVRLFLTNTANTRVFNVTLPGAEMKLVGADAGHYEREELVEEVLWPRRSGSSSTCTSRMRASSSSGIERPSSTYRLAAIRRSWRAGRALVRRRFADRRTNRDMAEHRERIRPFLEAPPDKTLSFVAEMDSAARRETSASSSARCIRK
jgi:hypothetical protein